MRERGDGLTLPVPSGLELNDPDEAPDELEGGLESAPGSTDDDDAYIREPVSGLLDPDLTVGSDPGRPLVFYQLDWPGERLRVTRERDGRLRLTF